MHYKTEIITILTKDDQIKTLLKRIEKLEIQLTEAQQWIDSEPDWKDQYYKRCFELVERSKQLELSFHKLKEAVERHKDINSYPNMVQSIIAAQRDEELYKIADEIGGNVK